MFIEQFGKLPVHAEFKIGGAKFIKISDTHAMSERGQRRAIGAKTVVDVETASDVPQADVPQMVAALEEVQELRRKAA